MESVGSPKEECKLNSTVYSPHIITSSSLTLFPHVSNQDVKEAKENVSGEGEVTEEARIVVVS